jgi:hypothetical protein
MFASRIERIEPERVLLTSRRTARIRVVGSARGWVRCGRERRWVWGRFDHSFVVRGPAATIAVVLVGLGGWTRRNVEVRAHWDLTPPRAPKRVRLSLLLSRAPRLRTLSRQALLRSQERAA